MMAHTTSLRLSRAIKNDNLDRSNRYARQWPYPSYYPMSSASIALRNIDNHEAAAQWKYRKARMVPRCWFSPLITRRANSSPIDGKELLSNTLSNINQKWQTSQTWIPLFPIKESSIHRSSPTLGGYVVSLTKLSTTT
jgi:hypothetical protein